MRISFFLTTPKRVSADNFIAGGSEMQSKGLGDALSRLGHDVHFYGNCEPSANYHSYEQYFEDVHDRIIMVRASNAIFQPVKREKFILWTGDAYDQPNNFVLNAPFVVGNRIDKVAFKSKWLYDTSMEHFPVLAASNKSIIMPNGVDPSHYFRHNEVKENFICTSRIYRGVDRFVYIWPRVRDEFGGELNLYVNIGGLYTDDDSRDDEFKNMFDALRSTEGINVHETISQSGIVEELHKHYLMLYPNFGFMESFCSSVMESMCAGTPVITTDRNALTGTVNSGFGKLIPDGLSVQEYTVRMLDYIRWFKKNPERYADWQEKRFELINKFSFDNMAKQWEEVLS